VLADLAIGRMRTAGKLADLSQALTGRFTEHHALLCRLHLDRIATFDTAVAGLEDTITVKAARWQREQDLLRTVPGFGDAVAQAGYRIFEETIRIDSSAYFLGLRLNMYIAIVTTLHRRPSRSRAIYRAVGPAAGLRDGGIQCQL
jgi:hypothetical protein